MRVYDGQTFVVLARQRDFKWQQSLVGGAIINGPNRQVDKTWWPASPAHVAQDIKLKQAMVELLDQSVATMLAELFPDEQAKAKR